MSVRAPAKKRTVLLVANFSPDVGFAWWLMENFWVQFADVARSQDFAALIAYPDDGEIPRSILEAGVETTVLPFPGSGLRALWSALRLVRTRRVAAVYFTDRPFTSLKYVLLRLMGVRRILNHDHTPGDRPPVRGVKGLLKAAWRRVGPASCDMQLCVSPLIRARAIENARIPRAKAMSVQNGIEPIECPEDRGYAHDVLDIPPEASICISVCRANPYKRVGQMIEVARRCVHEMGMEDLFFVHCGDGPEIRRLEALVLSEGLEHRVILAGKRTDVRELLCSADYALHTAKGEAFSLAILEYMSAGLAVLVPDIPTVRQAISPGETGLVFPDGDTAAAAALLRELEQRPGLAERLGAQAAAEVRRHYSLEAMNSAFRRLVHESLGGM